MSGTMLFQAVADLDADLLVLGHDEKHEPVIQALSADLPGFETP